MKKVPEIIAEYILPQPKDSAFLKLEKRVLRYALLANMIVWGLIGYNKIQNIITEETTKTSKVLKTNNQPVLNMPE